MSSTEVAVLPTNDDPDVSPSHATPAADHASKPPPEEEELLVLKIVHATYGPCEGTRLITGQNIMTHEPSASVPYTRDVTPILRALLQGQESLQQQQQQPNSYPKDIALTTSQNQDEEQEPGDDNDPHLVRLKAIAGGIGGMKRTSVAIQALQDGWNSMNVVFGDACPGTSKKLYIHYMFLPSNNHHPPPPPTLPQRAGDEATTTTTTTTTRTQKRSSTAAAAEVHHVSFAEYEPVILRRRVTFYQEDTIAKLQAATARVLAKNPTVAKTLLLEPTSNTSIAMDQQQQQGDNSSTLHDEDERILLVARRMGRSQSITDFARLTTAAQETTQEQDSSSILRATTTTTMDISPAAPPQQLQPLHVLAPRLRSASFETVLPMVLSFLQVPERVQCRLVCRLWRNIVRDWGVASVIDCNDPAYEHTFTRPFLRGILTNSYSSLHSLRLGDFSELLPEDFHPSLPHLRKLRVLDLSRCAHLQDETLQLLAHHVSGTLEVLYIKGLVQVSDIGILAICQACRKLRVLEVSHIPMTDVGGVAIGQHLTNLRALYMRDNYRLTNQSIDIITANCTKLNQLTLWGCFKVTRLGLEGHGVAGNGDGATNNSSGGMVSNPALSCAGKLVSLNLWGCLKLGDDIAVALGDMKNLRSLIVSECHKLTDKFAIIIAQSLPTLLHLHLRYCKRLTDNGVNAIAGGLKMLYSLDLSFCTKLTVSSICTLLDLRRETLSELRLQECRQLLIARDPADDVEDDSRRGQQQICDVAEDNETSMSAILKAKTLYGE